VLDYPGVSFMPPARHSLPQTTILATGLLSIALVSRIAAAYVLPNPEQDGYSYVEIIHRLTEHLETGKFRVSDLYGFWLPAFQSASAVLNLVVHEPMLAGKIINASCGAISIVLVFLIGRIVTGSVSFSLVASALMLVDPLHILYSAACMTDVPHATVVLVSVWFAVRRRWLGAALFAALAETIRVESWALIVALPFLQWLQQRRVSLPVYLIMLLPPLGWFALAFVATGSPLAYFAERAHYHAEYIEFHPVRVGFQPAAIIKDVKFLLLGADKTVFAGAVIAAAMTIGRWIRTRRLDQDPALGPIIYGGAILGLLILAYLTKSQPVWLPRYGLIFLALGLPLFARALQWSVSLTTVRFAKVVIVAGVIGACLFQMAKQKLPTIRKVQDDFRAQQQITTMLVANLKKEPTATHCFSDDVAVRVLSGLPPNTFLRSAFVPGGAAVNAEAFVVWLHDQHVQWLVFFPVENSIPVKLFPELGRMHQSSGEQFEKIAFAHSTFGPNIWLYRAR